MKTDNLHEYFYGDISNIIQPVPRTITDLRCSKCHDVKPVTAFHKDSRTVSGYHANCKICRGGKTDKPRRIERRIESKVWYQEAARACPCVACGQSPVLPNTVEAAREWLQSNPPLCEAHIDGNNLQTRMARRAWTQHAEERLLTIEVWHDITVKFKNFPRIRSSYRLAKAWLSGVRVFTNSNDLDDDQMMNLIEETTRGVVARDEPTDHLPVIISNRRWKSIREVELHHSDYETELEIRQMQM